MTGTSLKLCGKCTDIRYHAYVKYKCNRDSCLLCSEVNSSVLGLVGHRGQDLCIWDDSGINDSIRGAVTNVWFCWEVGTHMRVPTHRPTVSGQVQSVSRVRRCAHWPRWALSSLWESSNTFLVLFEQCTSEELYIDGKLSPACFAHNCVEMEVPCGCTRWA